VKTIVAFESMSVKVTFAPSATPDHAAGDPSTTTTKLKLIQR
jgi:hypothetical protein